VKLIFDFNVSNCDSRNANEGRNIYSNRISLLLRNNLISLGVFKICVNYFEIVKRKLEKTWISSI
jgi:hypothetical protein